MTDSTLDAIDAAFLRRRCTPSHRADGEPAPPPAAPEAGAMPEPAAAPAPAPARPPSSSGGTAVVDRLLDAAWPEWNALAAHVEAARLRGRRVIAVAGGEPREGRTTLVACLTAALRARGRDVDCITPQRLRAATAPAAGPLHDTRIVLVDAGIWFPPGPIRRQWLARCAAGSDAAVLVRRADRLTVAARHTVLESLGVEVLGEVLTFTDDIPMPHAESTS